MSKNKYIKVYSVKDILNKMGFNKNSPIETQTAFLQSLLNASNKNLNINNNKPNNKTCSKLEESIQLDLFKKVA